MKNDILKSTMLYGVFAGIAMVILETVLYLMDFSFLSQRDPATFLIIFVALYVSTKSYREKKLQGYLKYKQGIGYGTLVAFFASIIISFYMYILSTFVEPEYISKLLEKINQHMVEEKMSEAEIRQKMNFYRKTITYESLVNANILYKTLAGFFFSLITSSLLRKEKKEHII